MARAEVDPIPTIVTVLVEVAVEYELREEEETENRLNCWSLSLLIVMAYVIGD